jgi:hypothetical protein
VSSGTLTSAFDDDKPYELTELGTQFVRYTVEGVMPRIAAPSDAGPQASATPTGWNRPPEIFHALPIEFYGPLTVDETVNPDGVGGGGKRAENGIRGQGVTYTLKCLEAPLEPA